MTSHLLREPRSGAALVVPDGWTVVEDFGAALCEGPAWRADATGRPLAAQLRVEDLAGSAGLVPRAATEGGASRTAADVVASAVRDAWAADPFAWLLDHRAWSGSDGHAPGVRSDLTYRDGTTPVVVTTLVVPSGDGLVAATATVPVAHHRALAGTVEQALASLSVPGGPHLVKAPVAPSPLGDRVWTGPVPAVPRLGDEELTVFVNGSHRVGRRWRSGPCAEGLLEQDGTATPTGRWVRRALHRPDVLVALERRTGDATPRTWVTVHRLEGHAVLRSAHPGASAPTFEVLDVAAIPARLAAWLGLGPGDGDRAVQVAHDELLVGEVRTSAAPGVPATARPLVLTDTGRPLEVWHRVLAALS
ncbi:hypothetical protein [Sanguibacter suaedae]|uniref:Uncharacterized protein n=1 Tax=Sanguibacter suaedae TaxID=2795737 RepID=A0A934IBS4_9MICO|nr:hypothetical protein [Sanguibacter suaedae]MBI9115775.1 hypothetical protein [Sanguibacter suaedae]